MAGVLWPRLDARGTVVPHLVKCSGSGMAVEGLVRPRLPVVWTGDRERKRGAQDEDEDEEEEEEEEESDQEKEQDDVEMEAEIAKELNDVPEIKRRRLSKEEPVASGSAPVISNPAHNQGVVVGSIAEALKMSEQEKAEYPALYPVLPGPVAEPVVKAPVLNAPVIQQQPAVVETKKVEVKKVEKKVQQDVKMADAGDSDDDSDVEIVMGDSSDEESDDE